MDFIFRKIFQLANSSGVYVGVKIFQEQVTQRAKSSDIGTENGRKWQKPAFLAKISIKLLKIKVNHLVLAACKGSPLTAGVKRPYHL